MKGPNPFQQCHYVRMVLIKMTWVKAHQRYFFVINDSTSETHKIPVPFDKDNTRVASLNTSIMRLLRKIKVTRVEDSRLFCLNGRICVLLAASTLSLRKEVLWWRQWDISSLQHLPLDRTKVWSGETTVAGNLILSGVVPTLSLQRCTAGPTSLLTARPDQDASQGPNGPQGLLVERSI